MFKVGDEVAYGLHGKCVITGIATKELSTGAVSFYQVRTLKNPIAAKTANPHDAAILIPVDSARLNGLRPLMTHEEAEQVLQTLAEPDYHFELNETWVSKQKKLEEVIRKEGYAGLAKVIGHLHVFLQQDAVPPSNIMRFQENVSRIFARELAESLQITSKEAELLLARALKSKLAQDH